MTSQSTDATGLRLKVAVALFALLVVPQTVRAQQVYHGCGVAGDATSATARTLNQLKNRYTAPRPADLDSSVTLAALLKPGNDRSRWNEHRGASIVGYVLDVKPGGMETTNCHARDPQYKDTHISLVLDPMKTGALPVIVEVTPRWRATMPSHGEDWATRTLRQQLLGRWVRVTGWLLFDAEHANAAENTAPGHPANWRATAWEVHPVTAIQVVPRPH